MSDNYKDYNDYFNEENTPQNNTTENSEDIYSSTNEPNVQESSYEWNSGVESNNNDKTHDGEYHYSYVNGNNETASHNPNNYENAYSSTASNTQYTQNSYNSNYNDSQPYSTVNQQYSDYSQPSYSGHHYNTQNTSPYQQTAKPKKEKVKKPKKPASKGFIAAMLVITMLASAVLGFGGGYLANSMKTTSDGSININKVTANNASSETAATAGTTTEIVKKTADSVVEIATESVVTGNFAQQYIQQGAGSGVIISEDGYIITNNHVIDGANNITVTLRDGKSYAAAVIGSDADNDIALLKVDATGLKPATIGDSSTLAVGDYVVAIGNPLGELGGTVTDGIISALARDVTIEGKDMTLLQTNAQISPGNSGGGLFNANGELIGIVNAKDSATEVEGIAFAIPINNVLDIISDLKAYGYVTGKVDLGMQLADITSKETAFYYGVNQTGCYVLSVTKGSNADVAGFKTGDVITKVNGTEVTSSDEVNKALEDFKAGDQVKFTVYRSGKTIDLNLTLAEYVPSGNVSGQLATQPAQDEYSDDIWSQMFGW